MRRRPTLASLSALVLVAALALTRSSIRAYAGDIEDLFSGHAADSRRIVDHSAWEQLLRRHVVAGPEGINRVRYARWQAESRADLKSYIARLEAEDVTALAKPEQFAFWANLYNAKTIDIVLDKYPIKSIKDISLGGGLKSLVAGGPWQAQVTRVHGVALSLDDIEHRILRGLFKDARVHYALNCASLGCPNLQKEAFTGARLGEQLEAAAKAFVNSPRGITVENGRVTASSIYSWFRSDFGEGDSGVLAHVRPYAEAALAGKLGGATRIDSYAYDWSLNDAR